MVIEAPREKVDGEIFNVGVNELNMTIIELGEKVAAIVSGCSVERQVEMVDPRNYLVDFSKIVETLGFRPRFDIRDGVQEILRHHEKGLITTFDDPVYSNFKCLESQRSRVLPGVLAGLDKDGDKELVEIY